MSIERLRELHAQGRAGGVVISDLTTGSVLREFDAVVAERDAAVLHLGDMMARAAARAFNAALFDGSTGSDSDIKAIVAGILREAKP